MVFDWIATDGGSNSRPYTTAFPSASGTTRRRRSGPPSLPRQQPDRRCPEQGLGLHHAHPPARRPRTTIEDTTSCSPGSATREHIRVGPFQAGDRAGLAQAANHGSSITTDQPTATGRDNWMMTGDTAPLGKHRQRGGDILWPCQREQRRRRPVHHPRFPWHRRFFTPGDCTKAAPMRCRDGPSLRRLGHLYWRAWAAMAHEFGHYFGLPTRAQDAAHDFHVMHPVFREDRTFFEWSEYYKARITA